MPRLALRAIGHVHQSTAFRSCSSARIDGLPVESVLIPLHKPGAVSVCLSSQVGCAMGCVFCATARMPARRNLETWEIIDQFLQARELVRSQGRRVTGAVFMGMGEPFLNYDRVLGRGGPAALPLRRIGRCPLDHHQHSRAGAGDRPLYTDESRPFRLAISLGAATDDQARRLVPVAAALPSPRSWPRRVGTHWLASERVMLVYVCIAGVNVDESDAQALADLIGDTPVRLDLIEVTDHTGGVHATDTRRIQAIPRRARPAAAATRGPAIFRRCRHQRRLRHPGRDAG